MKLKIKHFCFFLSICLKTLHVVATSLEYETGTTDEVIPIFNRKPNLEEYTKFNPPRLCMELGRSGISQNGTYIIDPDGQLEGLYPINANCEFSDTRNITEIQHDKDGFEIKVDKCNTVGCFRKRIKYEAPMSQIKAIIRLSEKCEQAIHFQCKSAPLEDANGKQLGGWIDSEGIKKYFFDGNNDGEHICKCGKTKSCTPNLSNVRKSCECDANLPEAKFDAGVITSKEQLPITEVFYGPLLRLDFQKATFRVGPLRCYGNSSHYMTLKSELRTHIDSKYKLCQNELHSQISALSNKHAKEIKELSSKHAKEIKELESKNKLVVEKLESQVTKHAKEIKELESKNELAIEKLESQFSQLSKELKTKNLAGPPGPPGVRGERGSSGSKGERGITGNPGPKGGYGARGERGSQGPKGQRGVTGNPGPKGDGARGERGSQGPKGERGVAGNPGPKGERGHGGQNGAKGERGSRGPKGQRGITGNPGPKGDGARGERGSQGPKGQRGVTGNPGPKGERGHGGQNGARGERGSKGPKGERGVTGNPGPKGDGAKGERGSKGPKGQRGVTGNPGPKGEGKEHIGFSCHRDSKFDSYAILSYTTCNINDGNMMTTSTGKVKISADGEYFITFYARARVIDQSSIFCNLIQKSGSTKTHLGSVGNDLVDGDAYADNKNSISMSLIANLKNGDELYIKVNPEGGSPYLYGDSHWPYISFSGFLLK